MEEKAICPECAQGKCGNCDGSAWDNKKDDIVPCACSAEIHSR